MRSWQTLSHLIWSKHGSASLNVSTAGPLKTTSSANTKHQCSYINKAGYQVTSGLALKLKNTEQMEGYLGVLKCCKFWTVHHFGCSFSRITTSNLKKTNFATWLTTVSFFTCSTSTFSFPFRPFSVVTSLFSALCFHILIPDTTFVPHQPLSPIALPSTTPSYPYSSFRATVRLGRPQERSLIGALHGLH